MTERTMDRRYIAWLAAIAVVIIGAGLLIRDRIIGDASPQTTPLSEALPVQQLSQAGQLQDIARFMKERAAAAAQFVVLATDSGPSGIRWGGEGALMTTSAARPVVLQNLLVPDSSSPAAPRSALPVSDSISDDWVLVVARGLDDKVLSLQGISGGRTTRRCGDRTIETLILGLALPADFAGGGVFDLDGRLRGMIVRCGDSAMAAIPVREIVRLAADTATAIPDTAKAIPPQKAVKPRAAR